MKRNKINLIIVTLFAAFFLSACSEENERPNVLFIAVDDLKPLLNCYGYEFAITPNFDRLAEQGIIFRSAYCQQAVCGASRISIMTGRYPDVTGIYGMGPRDTWLRERHPDIVTLPQYFKQNGYYTVANGKLYDFRNFENDDDPESWSDAYSKYDLKFPETWGTPAAHPNPHSAGFQRPDTKANAIRAWELIDELNAVGGLRGRDSLLRAEKARPPVECIEIPDDCYEDGQFGLWGRDMIRKLASSEDKNPFFMALGFLKPHLPFVAPKKFWDLYERESLPLPAYRFDPKGILPFVHLDYNEGRTYEVLYDEAEPLSDETNRMMLHGYLACVSYIDQQIGLLLDELEATGLDKNTVIVLWGDHGFFLGDHDIWGKASNWEEAVRVPLMMSAPWIKPAGASDSYAELVDVYPTLCDLAGLDIPELDGKSLVPIMKDPATTIREGAVSCYPRYDENGSYLGFAIRKGQYRYIVWYKTKEVTGKGKYIQGEPVLTELYDYKFDPDEKENLSGKVEYKTIEPELMELLSTHIEYTQGNKL